MLGKMEAVADLWVTKGDWVSVQPVKKGGVITDRIGQDVLGMRSLKERSFFL